MLVNKVFSAASTLHPRKVLSVDECEKYIRKSNFVQNPIEVHPRMRQRLLVLAHIAAFWLTFAVAIRGLFLLYNYDLSSQLNARVVCLVFLDGLKMDLSLPG